VVEQSVDDRIELHSARVLAKVVLWLQEQTISPPIGAAHCYALWMLLRVEDVHLILHRLELHYLHTQLINIYTFIF